MKSRPNRLLFCADDKVRNLYKQASRWADEYVLDSNKEIVLVDHVGLRLVEQTKLLYIVNATLNMTHIYEPCHLSDPSHSP